MIEIRPIKARSGANGHSIDPDGRRVRVRSGGAPGGWLVLHDGRIVDSFLTKANAEAKAKLLRERSSA